MAALVVPLVVLAGARMALLRVRAVGDSMEPVVRSGDHLVVLRVARSRTLRPGDLVALHDPRLPPREGRLLVKRVLHSGTSGVDVRGDNADRSTDSRTFGPVPRDRVVGRVVYRYAPPSRAGRVR